MDEGFEPFDDYRLTIEKLCYMGENEGGRAKSSGRQRGYIRGLLSKLDLEEEDLLLEMGIDVPVSDFSLSEASDAIELLLAIQSQGKR